MPARDLEKDLAICKTATPGPWFAHIHRDDSAEIATEAGGVSSWICQTWYKDEDVMPNSSNNAHFIAEAREGWPYAIRRALEAEAEIDRLRNELNILQQQLNGTEVRDR